MGGRGTDVAKETADIVLRDDRFQTIGAAVEEGRVIFENIRKFVFYLFSCNLAEVLVLLAASVAGLPLPLLPLQILWLNLVTDTFPALALALEPAEPGIMQRRPRHPDASILSRDFVRAMAFYAGLITLATLAAYVWGLGTGDAARAVTIAFMTLGLAQLFHLGNARARGPVLSFRRATANPWALAAVPLVIALQLLAVYWQPLADVLRTVPLSPGDWLVVFGLSAIPAVVGQAASAIRRGAVSEP
jgi:Ca2+-transporting ATPase